MPSPRPSTPHSTFGWVSQSHHSTGVCLCFIHLCSPLIMLRSHPKIFHRQYLFKKWSREKKIHATEPGVPELTLQVQGPAKGTHRTQHTDTSKGKRHMGWSPEDVGSQEFPPKGGTTDKFNASGNSLWQHLSSVVYQASSTEIQQPRFYWGLVK